MSQNPFKTPQTKSANVRGSEFTIKTGDTRHTGRAVNGPWVKSTATAITKRAVTNLANAMGNALTKMHKEEVEPTKRAIAAHADRIAALEAAAGIEPEVAFKSKRGAPNG